MFDKIKFWHDKGLWTEKMVLEAVDFGILTKEESDLILNN